MNEDDQNGKEPENTGAAAAPANVEGSATGADDAGLVKPLDGDKPLADDKPLIDPEVETALDKHLDEEPAPVVDTSRALALIDQTETELHGFHGIPVAALDYLRNKFEELRAALQ